MRLSAVLSSPPKFHFWRDFGWGKRRKAYWYNFWFRKWQRNIQRAPIADHTLTLEQLPPGSRLMDAEDFMIGPIDAMPEQLLKIKNEPVVYDHPWPYNVRLDPIKSQKPMQTYEIGTRFFMPRDDAQVLTNTVLETDQLDARPPFEPNHHQIETIKRHHEWALTKDSVLVRLPRRLEYPMINKKPPHKFGITAERKEVNTLNAYYDFSRALLTKHYFDIDQQQQQQQHKETMQEINSRRTVAFPHCQVPFDRESRKLNLNLCLDAMSLSRRPLPQIELNPEATRDKEAINIEPRGWASLVEPSRTYKPDWTFTLPQNSYPHTILLAARIKRDLRDPDEMLARSLVHAFGLAAQFARFRAFSKRQLNENISHRSSIVLQDPLSVQTDDEALLREPIVLQAIGYDSTMGRFCFTRFQLNTLNFDDANEKRVKNQAWYSGPVTDTDQALRYYLDFQSFDLNAAQRTLLCSAMRRSEEADSVKTSQ